MVGVIKERINKLDFDAVVLGWSMGIDPGPLPDLATRASRVRSSSTSSATITPRPDDLIIRIRQEYDFDRRVELCIGCMRSLPPTNLTPSFMLASGRRCSQTHRHPCN